MYFVFWHPSYIMQALACVCYVVLIVFSCPKRTMGWKFFNFEVFFLLGFFCDFFFAYSVVDWPEKNKINFCWKIWRRGLELFWWDGSCLSLELKNIFLTVVVDCLRFLFDGHRSSSILLIALGFDCPISHLGIMEHS